MHGPGPPRPASATLSAPSGPKASPRGLSSPLMTTLVVAAPALVAPASATTSAAIAQIKDRLGKAFLSIRAEMSSQVSPYSPIGWPPSDHSGATLTSPERATLSFRPGFARAPFRH